MTDLTVTLNLMFLMLGKGMVLDTRLGDGALYKLRKDLEVKLG